MTTYRVRPGRHFGGLGASGPGALVELSPAEAAPFLDKLEPVAALPPDGTPAVDLLPLPVPDGLPAAWVDFGDLSKHLNMIRLLVANGYTTPQAVQQASDEELLAIKGIGPKALGALRAVLGGEAT